MSDFTVVVDSREQAAYDFKLYPVDTVVDGLKTGDYAIEGYEKSFVVERKSVDDLANCCAGDRDRFYEQLRRGERMTDFAVVVEGTRRDIEQGDYYSNVHPNSVLGTVDAWDGVPFHFEKNAIEAEKKTYELLENWYELVD